MTKEKFIGIRAKSQEIQLIDLASKKDMRTRSSFMVKSAIDRANQILGSDDKNV